MDVKIIRSNRKTVAIQVNSDLSITVRAPHFASEKDIEKILMKKEAWISKHIEEIKTRKKRFESESTDKFTPEKIKLLADKALEVIPMRVEYFANIMGVTYGNITIRNQKTRWGSCSVRGNINYNWKLVLLPVELADYVVVHELAHRTEMNHSKDFWKVVERELPDYRQRRRRLKGYESEIKQKYQD